MPLSESSLLYIDDDEGLCRLAKRRLERLGCAVDYALDGCAGVRMAREKAYDLIALDHIMPGQGGLETLEALCKLPNMPAVIYVTGADDTSVAVAALKAGAYDYVVKSASEDFYSLLSRTLHQALDMRRVRAERDAVEQRLRDSNVKLEALLHEMNHRVANSLQLVSSLVGLQMRVARQDETRGALKSVRARIQAISRVHRQLYTGDGSSSINMPDYLDGLARDLLQTVDSPEGVRRLTVSADPLIMPTNQAVMLGVLINELVSNAFKYAYASHEPGEVRVRLEARGEKGFCLTIEDDGNSYDACAKPKGTGLGSQIIQAMASSLGARASIAGGPHGCRAVIESEE